MFACLALPLMLVLFLTYSLSHMAFNAFSSTGSKIRQIKHMVAPAITTEESPKRYVRIYRIFREITYFFPCCCRSVVSHSSGTPGKSCTDGTAFLPACITDSDTFFLAQMNDRKL